jgi:hypothetical protein
VLATHRIEAHQPKLLKFGDPKNIRILPPISERFIRTRGLTPDFAKTYGNLGHRIACRKTDDFPGPARASLNGRFLVVTKNV